MSKWKRRAKEFFTLEESDEDIYNEEYADELLDADEISPEEEAFMTGYNMA